jgi:2-polyprenyl-6-methoxyphenol hydroxylase-like FAD-dependent oxidoreductase
MMPLAVFPCKIEAKYRRKLKQGATSGMAERIVIVGGSIAGLATALALSRIGKDVVVLEQDAPPPQGSTQELFTTWKRRGVPQLRHSHGFLARLRNLLRDRYPDLLEALLAEGAREQSIGDSLPPVLAPAYRPAPDDDDLTGLLCRRTTFERVLHAYVSEQPRVSLQSGVKVYGLRHTLDHAVPRLTGLLLQQGETPQEMDTETIIDATGRLSPFPSWLRDLGAELLEDQHETGIVYYTRYYRLRDGVEAPRRTNHSSMGDLGYLKFGVFPADRQTFSLTLAIPTVETDLRILKNNDVFSQVCQCLPALSPWLDPACSEPTTNVFIMGGLRNTYRQFVVDNQPVVHGFLAVGEAAIHTNPLYGRGCSLSFLHAHLLADAFAAHSHETERLRHFHHATTQQLQPFYEAAVQRDTASLRRAQQGMSGPRPLRLRERLMRSFVQHGLATAMRGDLHVRRAFLRDFHMLEPPNVAIRRPGILLRILRFWLRGKRRNAHLYTPSAGPNREEMRRLLGLAA